MSFLSPLNPSFAMLVRRFRPSVTFFLTVLSPNRSGPTFVFSLIFHSLLRYSRLFFPGPLAVPDFWVANMVIVCKPVTRWLFTLCGLPIVRPSTTITLVRALLSRTALNSSFVAISLPSLPLVFLPGSVPFPLLSFLNLYIFSFLFTCT